MKKIYFLFLSLSLAGILHAQNDVVDDILNETKPKYDYVGYTFKSTRVICGHSIEMTKKNALDFRISHRFGDIATPNAAHSLAGFYAISDILFSFEYGATDDLTVGIMGTKGAGPMQELYSGFIKYRVLKQTKDFKIPMTITLFGNASVSGQKYDPFVVDDKGAQVRFKDVPNGAMHRFSYTLQALMAVKATDWLSVQLSPTFVWRNEVSSDNNVNYGKDKNGMFFLGLSARAKVTKRQAILFEYFMPITVPGATYREYFPMLRGITNAKYYPCLNIGYEIETGGHVFTINLTNTEALVENDFLPYTSKTWMKGEFRLGFTISRIFQFGNKAVNPWTGKPKKQKVPKAIE
jgi:hypothetical protein